jgi:hypothetical protein
MVAADYRISMCFADAQGIYVNLYVPAQVSWRQGTAACQLSISTDYPYASAIALTVHTPGTQTFSVNLRIPAWAQGASVSINGKRSAQTLEPGTFAVIRREWRSGDRIELDLPLPLRLQPVDAEHPNTVALLAGPLVLMRVLDETPPSAATSLTRAALSSATRKSGSAHEWHAGQDAQTIALRPFIDIQQQTYTAYQDVSAPA